WNSDLVTFAQNALAPAKINRVAVREEPIQVPVFDEEGNPILNEEGEPLTEEGKEIVLDVIVGTEQLSLTIGRRGQNVRLASRLLESRIEIKSEEAVKDELASALASMLREMEGVDDVSETEAPEATEDLDYDLMIPLEEMEMISERLRERLESHAIHTAQDVLGRTPDELATIPGIGPVTAQRLQDMVQQAVDEARAEAAEAEGE
ncbi:MAG: helix-hairpin-helix domain-containing protein, partial [Acidobacteriota bacterium]